MPWQRLATRTGGTVSHLALARAPDGVPLIFAATSVGVHRSSDGGRSWALAGAVNNVALGEAVAPSPSFARDRTIFVGARDGLYRSSDGGESWQPVLTSSRTLSLTCAPDEGGGSLLLAGTETDGILRSDDAGRTWASANPGLLDLTVLALALSP